MKIGEIKRQALMLIFPNIELEYDEDSIEDLVYSLKSSPSYSSYLSGSVGAINRALASIEQKGLSGKGSITLSLEDGVKNGGYLCFDLSRKREILQVKCVLLNSGIHQGETEFEMLDNSTLAIKCQDKKGSIQIVYSRRLARISHATSASDELLLEGGIEEIIPYFVKADLLLGERSEEAVTSRNIYEKMIEEYISKSSRELPFKTVYSLGDI